METEAEMGVMQLQAKNIRDCRQPLETQKGQERMFSLESSGRMTMLIPRFWISGLQNRESIHFRCFKPPRLWVLATAAPGD